MTEQDFLPGAYLYVLLPEMRYIALVVEQRVSTKTRATEQVVYHCRYMSENGPVTTTTEEIKAEGGVIFTDVQKFMSSYLAGVSELAAKHIRNALHVLDPESKQVKSTLHAIEQDERQATSKLETCIRCRAYLK